MAERWVSFAAAFIVALGVGTGLGIGHAWAQVGKGYDTSLPIEITADALEVRQEEQIAVFTGNVDAVQGELNLRADRLVVYYRANAKESNAISLIEAFGNVFLSSPTETAQGEKGVYNLDTDTIELTGGVVLTRGESVIRGDRLDMDLASGRTRVSSTSVVTQQGDQGSGRVKALFVPSNDDAE